MSEIIKTGVEGLDTILNGGIVKEDNVVIVLRGSRGIYKTLLGMQMMLGIQNYFETSWPQKEYPVRFYSLNKSLETLRMIFGGLVVSREVENIKKGKLDKLRSYLDGIGGGYASFEEDVKHQVLSFDSNSGRFRYGGKDSQIFRKDKIEDNFNLVMQGSVNAFSRTNYLESNLNDFSKMMEDIENLPSNEDHPQACIVVDGLSRMTQEEIARLPLERLEKDLRNRSKISILILNDSEAFRNLDADIIIDMQRNFDRVHNYTYHELSVVKNVKGQFAFGWHKYKPMNGLIYVYPSIHKLLSQQHSVDNTFIQAINTDARYAQPFAEMSSGGVPMSLGQGTIPTDFPDRRISENEELDTPKDEQDILSKLITPHKVEKGRITSIIGNHNTFKRFIVSVSILNSIIKGNEVFVLLLNERRKGMIELIDKIRKDAGFSAETAVEAYRHLFFWEVRMGCISPEELISFVLEYIEMRKGKKVELYIIDLGTIEQCFPMINNESLFVPTLSTLCREKKVDLHLICNKHFSQRSVVCTVADNLICTKRNSEDNNNQLTMLLEKNDFGADYNCKVFELKATVYKDNGQFNVSIENGMVVFSATPKEITTTKDYWRKTVNVVPLTDNEGDE